MNSSSAAASNSAGCKTESVRMPVLSYLLLQQLCFQGTSSPLTPRWDTHTFLMDCISSTYSQVLFFSFLNKKNVVMIDKPPESFFLPTQIKKLLLKVGSFWKPLSPNFAWSIFLQPSVIPLKKQQNMPTVFCLCSLYFLNLTFEFHTWKKIVLIMR